MYSRWVEVTTFSQCQVKEHFKYFYLLDLTLKQNQTLKCMWVAVIWCIWNQRNEMVFRNDKDDVEEIFSIYI